MIALANGRGETGALVMFNYAAQVFNSLNAVLVLSIVLSAFPVLSARDGAVFDRTCAGSTRAVVLMACLGMATIGAVAVPAAHVLARQPDQVSQLIAAFAFFAPGLVGAGVLANLMRALLAIGRLKVACAAVAGGFLLAALAQVVLAEIVPTHLVVAALALGNSIGMTGAAIPLVIITRRIRGPAAVRGVGRAALVGLAAAVAGAVAGVAVSVALPASHKLADAVVATLAAACAVVVFGAVALRFDNGDLRVIVAQLRQAVSSRALRFVPANLSSLAVDARQRGSGHLLRVRTIWQGPGMNSHDQQRFRSPDETGQHPDLMTRRERQGALGIGVAAGVAGGYAVFASSNDAGTAVLLLIALVFLLAGVEGTPLVRVLGSFSGELLGRRRASRVPRQADDEQHHRGAAGMGAGISTAESERVPTAQAGVASYGDQVVALADEHQRGYRRRSDLLIAYFAPRQDQQWRFAAAPAVALSAWRLLNAQVRGAVAMMVPYL